jgi:hypothetical protein
MDRRLASMTEEYLEVPTAPKQVRPPPQAHLPKPLSTKEEASDACVNPLNLQLLQD